MKFEYLFNEKIKNSYYTENNQSFINEIKEMMHYYNITIY